MPRFASEYGFQAFPGFEVMSNYSLPQDRNFYSEYVDHIQHHGDGNAQLKSQLSTKVRLRSSGLGFIFCFITHMRFAKLLQYALI